MFNDDLCQRMAIGSMMTKGLALFSLLLFLHFGNLPAPPPLHGMDGLASFLSFLPFFSLFFAQPPVTVDEHDGGHGQNLFVLVVTSAITTTLSHKKQKLKNFTIVLFSTLGIKGVCLLIYYLHTVTLFFLLSLSLSLDIVASIDEMRFQHDTLVATFC